MARGRRVLACALLAERFDGEKLLPWTDWEFTKWTGKDYAGFFGCWGIVGMILLLLLGIVGLGK